MSRLFLCIAKGIFPVNVNGEDPDRVQLCIVNQIVNQSEILNPTDMKIGIIGAGAIGKAFAQQVAQAGYQVMISNSRGPETLAELAHQLGDNVSSTSVEQAATAEVVFLAVPWQKLRDVALSIPSLQGRIVIDPTNPILPGFKLANLGVKTSSEVVAELFPGARVVKAFNTLPPHLVAADPNQAAGHRVLFYSGNDQTAKDIVAGIVNRLGFAGIDLGRLDEGGKLQQFPNGVLAVHNLIKLS
ncbi:NADPH-dependent F420 reductase [Xanthocytophaga agilis]|uniref:NAD(P)-binding domain-containing protein n=1 Tax=Xanthocytophaga agilis TaxID=3048010 RepID=A0AAE3R9P4_9BACT|nr:NAD(P)-binding domain-containing protein [Xanthocytophaga agilis]MDJ1505820.1 NAD(P)-binding domain-containing protein [Xanthocytophaga agilis]